MLEPSHPRDLAPLLSIPVYKVCEKLSKVCRVMVPEEFLKAYNIITALQGKTWKKDSERR
jgi:hypothetical protein